MSQRIELLALIALLLSAPDAPAEFWQDSAAHWRVTLKDGRTISSADLSVKQAGQSMTWAGDVRVTVTAAMDGKLVRSRVKVETVKPGIGLKNVTYPVVEGIKPLSENDRVLKAFRMGMTLPSPLETGKPLNVGYTGYMQFTALLGDGRGIYFGEHDPTAAQKSMDWTSDKGTNTLTYGVGHPVLDWGGDQPVTHYESPGDVVFGPFDGDWYDAARLYRKWALTAPWCAKGPIYQRDDYPQWFVNTDYWTSGQLQDATHVGFEFVKRDYFDFPISITHDYGYYSQPYQHDVDPEYFPPRLGSVHHKRIIGELRKRGARVIPYVMGWMWNAALEDYQRRNAKEQGAMLTEGGDTLWAELSPAEECVAMCLASKLWRDKLTEVSVEFVKRYGCGGVYFDYFSVHMSDCHNPVHNHALGGGDYWTASVRGLYQQVRDTVHQIDPDAVVLGEDAAEFCIDQLDAHHECTYFSDAPIFLVVYHGYTQTMGGLTNKSTPVPLGRHWLYGCMNGRTNQMSSWAQGKSPRIAQWYRKLIRCHHEFARPYLGYGEMLRPPVIEGDLPVTTHKGPYGPFQARAVEGSAWRAPDGSIGVFFINYADQPHRFTWKIDVDTSDMKIARWEGGPHTPALDIEPLGIIALKMEPTR